MAGYIGTKCIVCNEEFKNSDDIVVCPECGTPYHRECYKKSGKCVNTDLHANGESWKPLYEEEKVKPSDSVICPRCGTKNNPLTFFCENCGMPLAPMNHMNIYQRPEDMRTGADPFQNKVDYDPRTYNKNVYGANGFQPYMINFSDPLCGYNPNEDYEGIKLAELGDYVETNTHYYLPLFKRIKETGRMFTWNFTALLFPELYFSNRKMPFTALLFLIVRTIISVPDYIVVLKEYDNGLLASFVKIFNTSSPEFEAVKILTTMLGYAIMVFSGGFANWIYYRHALKSVNRIKKKTAPENLRMKLRQKGGTSGGLLALFICLCALPLSALYIYGISVMR